MAIKFCSINLSKDLLPLKDDYDQFVTYFNLTVQTIAYDMGGRLASLVPDESQELWGQVMGLAKTIVASSNDMFD
jgi:hypothetical protein